MDALQYVSKLTPAQIHQTQQDSLALWGAGLTLPTRVERLSDLLQFAGPDRFRVSGLVDSRGFVPCSLKRHDLVLNVAGTLRNTLGIGAVFTAQAYRKNGLARQLIEAVLEEATQENYELAVLFSDIDPSYYAKLGFIEIPAWRYEFELSTLLERHPSDQALDFRLATAADLPKLLQWYDSSWPHSYTRPDRDPFRWEFFRRRIGYPADLILSQDSLEIGYLTLSQARPNVMWIDEIVVAPQFVNRAWSTISRLAMEKRYSGAAGFLPKFLLPEHISERTRRNKAVPMVKELRAGALAGLEKGLAHFNGPDLF